MLGPLKCAVFFSGLRGVNYDSLLQGTLQRLEGSYGLIRLPTAHIWGKNDWRWSKESEALSGACEENTRSVYIHKGGHEVPGPRLEDSMIETLKMIRRTIDRAASTKAD